MSSTDSSDDEMTQKLRAAVAPQFSKVYSENHHAELSTQPQKSLRPCKEEQFHSGGITQEFRDHVANHLTAMLDMILKDKLRQPKHIGPVHKPKNKGGVKLFRQSQSYVKVSSKVEEDAPQKPRPRPRRRNDSEITESKLRACAVTIEQVQNETKAWSNRSKAPVYHYKQTDKGLEYQPPPFV